MQSYILGSMQKNTRWVLTSKTKITEPCTESPRYILEISELAIELIRTFNQLSDWSEVKK